MSTWIPKGLALLLGYLSSSSWVTWSTTCDIDNLGRSVIVATPRRDVLPLFSRDGWRGMTSSWQTDLENCCSFVGQEIFLIGLGGDDKGDEWWWEIFLRTNIGLATRLTASLPFLRDGIKGSLRVWPLGYVEARFIISVDLAFARFKLSEPTCKELWLSVFRKPPSLPSFVNSGSVTEILRRWTNKVAAEGEQWSDEFECCFESCRFRAVLPAVLEESFLVQAFSVWLLVFTEPLPFCLS